MWWQIAPGRGVGGDERIAALRSFSLSLLAFLSSQEFSHDLLAWLGRRMAETNTTQTPLVPPWEGRRHTGCHGVVRGVEHLTS